MTTKYLPYQSLSPELRSTGRKVLYFFPKGLDPNSVEGLCCCISERSGCFNQCSTIFLVEEVPHGGLSGPIKGSHFHPGITYDFVCDRARDAYIKRAKTGKGPAIVFTQIPVAATNYECVLHILSCAERCEEDDNDLDPYDYSDLQEYYVYDEKTKGFNHLNGSCTTTAVVSEPAKGAKTKKKPKT